MKTSYEKIAEIAAEGQAQKVQGFLVDIVTANLLINICKNLSEENKSKFTAIIEKDLQKAVNIAWQLTK